MSKNTSIRTEPEQTPEQTAAPAAASSATSSMTTQTREPNIWRARIPGVLVCLVAAGVSWLIAGAFSGVSALLVAILLGALWRNIFPVPAMMGRGVAFSAKPLLRTGIVLLGFQVSLKTVADLGWGVVFVIVAAVALTFFATLWIGKMMGIAPAQRMLIACGFSICGAAAVAGADGAVDAEENEVATAIALVVLYGTLMIPLMPFLTTLVGMDAKSAGMWAGASIHEVAQVVAVGGTIGGGALAIAVTVKLARVMTLAPMIAGINLANRFRGAETTGKRPPIVPLFVIGFIATMVIRTFGIIPEPALDIIQIMQTVLLAAAMFALGLGVHLRTIFKVGAKPVVLGLISTLIILVVGYAGTMMFPPA